MKKYKSVFLWLAFIWYAVFLCEMLFIRRLPMRSINIVPLHSILLYMRVGGGLFAVNIVGNVIVFVPLGVYLAALKKCKNFFVSLLIVAACSVSAEIVQYIFSVGVSDIDDVILNCVGGCIGIGGWKILSSALKNENAVKNITLVFAVMVTVLSAGVLLR